MVNLTSAGPCRSARFGRTSRISISSTPCIYF